MIHAVLFSLPQKSQTNYSTLGKKYCDIVEVFCFVHFFSLAMGLVVRFTSGARGPEALMRMSEKHLCRCCAVEENPCGFHSFEPINLLRAQCGKKSPQKNPFRDHKEVFGFANKCLQGCSLCCLCLAWGKTICVSFQYCQYGIFHHHIIYL